MRQSFVKVIEQFLEETKNTKYDRNTYLVDSLFVPTEC